MSNFKKELNPKLYKGEELKPEVLKKLKEIAAAFIEFLEIPKEAVVDEVITGSCASYNYTRHSDIDLHIIVDPDKVHEDCPIVGPYLLSKKSEFNQKHDIYIYGIPVEVYTELEGQGTIHNGLYSLNNGWIDFPQKIKPLKNSEAVKAKYEEYVEAANEIKEGDLAEKLLDKIKRMRKSGLEEGGEFSVENLVFKKLRDNGVIGKLMKIKKEKVDKELSLEEMYESLISSIEEMICTSTAVMAPYPVSVVGRPVTFTKIKSAKKSGGEKRAPHTEIHEECEKQNNHREHSAMYKFSYKKNGKIRKRDDMDIFESLENLEISEECFNEIMDIVEEIINERSVNDIKKAAKNSVDIRQDVLNDDGWANNNNRLKKARRLIKELPNSKRDIKTLVDAANRVLASRKEKNDASFHNAVNNPQNGKINIATPEKKRFDHARLIASLGKGGGISPLIKNDSRPDERTRRLDAKANERARKLRVEYNKLYNDNED